MITWPTVKMGNICFSTQQRDPRNEMDGSFQYIDISSIDKEKKEVGDTLEVFGPEAPSRARKEVRSGDVLISTVRPNLNTIAVVPSYLDGQIASTGFTVLRSNPKQTTPKFLFYWAQSSTFIDYLLSRMKGASYPAVSDKIVKDAPIPLPALSEQFRMVEILDQAEILLKKRGEADRIGDKILPAAFYRLFGDPTSNPKRLRIGTFNDLFEMHKEMIGAKGGEGIPYLGLEHIETQSGRILINEEIASGIEVRGNSFIFSPDHVLYGKLRPYLNKVALPNFAGRCSTEMVPLKPRNGITREFVASILRTPFVVNKLMAANKGAQMPRADMDILINSEIYIPPKDLQDKYRSLFVQYMGLRDNGIAIAKRLNGLFEVLLQQAFSGSLTALWREARLEKILQEMKEQAEERNLVDIPEQL